MLRVLSGFCLGVLLCGAVQAQEPVCPLGAEYRFNRTMSDEFNGAALDSARWMDLNPTFYGRKPGVFDHRNVGVKDGMLELWARALKPEEVSYENRLRGFDRFSTAIVKSRQKVRYGYFEARCKGMHAAVCNAFWLYDPLSDAPEKKHRPGDVSEEIDIAEFFGKSVKPGNERILFNTVHCLKTPYVEATANGGVVALENRSGKTKVEFDFWADFHTYGCLWTPQEIRWYLDGKEVFRRTNDYFKRPLHLMLDCEIMETWVGLPDTKDLPAVFQVDYVHVWDLPK